MNTTAEIPLGSPPFHVAVETKTKQARGIYRFNYKEQSHAQTGTAIQTRASVLHCARINWYEDIYFRNVHCNLPRSLWMEKRVWTQYKRRADPTHRLPHTPKYTRKVFWSRFEISFSIRKKHGQCVVWYRHKELATYASHDDMCVIEFYNKPQ